MRAAFNPGEQNAIFQGSTYRAWHPRLDSAANGSSQLRGDHSTNRGGDHRGADVSGLVEGLDEDAWRRGMLREPELSRLCPRLSLGERRFPYGTVA